MSIIRRLAGGETRGADPTLPWGSSFIPTNAMLSLPNSSGVNMTPDAAMAVSVVHACVRALADDVATLPFNSYVASNDRSKVLTSSPLVVRNPWPEGTRMDWMLQVMVSLCLRGNFYGLIVDRDPDTGMPVTIKPLDPDMVTPKRNPTTGKREYRYQGALLRTADVFHIPALLMPGTFVGLDPVSYMRNSWGLASSAEQYGGTFFRNSAQPGGVIEVPEDLDELEALELARSWKQSHQGISGSNLPAVLTGGASWKQMSVSPDNAQFLQTRDFQRVEIAGFFGVPLHRLGLQDRTSNTGVDAESAEMYYITNTLVPWLARIESYFSLPTVTPPQISVQFDLDGRLRGNTITRYQAWTLGRNGGWLSSDDIRAKENLPDLPDGVGKTYWGPLNFAPLDKLIDGTAVAPGGMGAGTVPSGQGGPGGGIDQNPGSTPAGGAKQQKNEAPTINVALNDYRPQANINVRTPDVHVGGSTVTNNMPASVTNVAAPDVRVAAPNVNVEAPNVTVESPTVNVAAADVQVNPLLTIESKAPDVHVTVERPTPNTVRRVVERNKQGDIVAVREES